MYFKIGIPGNHRQWSLSLVDADNCHAAVRNPWPIELCASLPFAPLLSGVEPIKYFLVPAHHSELFPRDSFLGGAIGPDELRLTLQ
jgi:hypothetical protein